MAEVTIDAAELPLIPMPPICARTGRMTNRTAKVQIVKTPWWVWFGLLGGVLVLALLAFAGSKKLVVQVPIAPGRMLRKRLAFAGIMLLLLPLMGGTMGLFFEPGLVSTLVFAVSAALTGACVYVYRTAAISGRWVDESTVKLTRLHPEFARTLQASVDHRREMERRAALAGWHPDPSGQHRLRYFDGGQWTEHVA